MDETTIQSALTSDEWAAWYNGAAVSREERGGASADDPLAEAVVFDSRSPFESDIDGDPLHYDTALLLPEQDSPATVPARHLPALMALANDLLPDGDPRKITPEDVALLSQLAYEGRDTYWIDDDGLRVLAAKLAALLPPDE